MTSRARYLLVALATTGCNPGKDSPDSTSFTSGVAETSGGAETSDTGGTTTGGSGDETSATTETGSFVPDMPESTPSLCDPWVQDCPEGEKCVPYSSDGEPSWDANKCVPIMGDGVAGDSCISSAIVDGTDDCGPDSICWDVMDVGGEPVGVCTSLCGGTPAAPVCEPGTSCIILNDGTITLCIANCDPLLQDCDAGLGCFWANENFNCIPTLDIPTGEPCGYINDCAAGNYCAEAVALPSCNGDACCVPFCDVTNPNCDAIAGTECVTFFDEGMAPPGYDDVGVCVLPE